MGEVTRTCGKRISLMMRILYMPPQLVEKIRVYIPSRGISLRLRMQSNSSEHGCWGMLSLNTTHELNFMDSEDSY